MENIIKPYIIDFANRSFRDVADQDYIAARASYRLELDQQFLWSSLQAIEKYFKAILLYNGISSKGINHNLAEALKRVEKIEDINFHLPEDVIDFVNYINTYGPNRYLEFPSHLSMDALIELDKTVWHIRRYCYFLRATLKSYDGTLVFLLPYELQKIHHEYYLENPHKYKISGGFLEKATSNKKICHKALVWNNFYFGKKKRIYIKNFNSRTSSVNPTLTLHPESFEELDGLVYFSSETRKIFKQS